MKLNSPILGPIINEIRKIRITNPFGMAAFLACLLWPTLEGVAMYFMAAPFAPSALGQTHHEIGAFVVGGVLVFNIASATIRGSWFFTFERLDGTAELLLMAPVRRPLLFTGIALAYSLEPVVILAAGIVAGFAVLSLEINALSASTFAVIIMLSLITSVSIGVFLSAVFISQVDATPAYNIIVTPMRIFSGTFYPITNLPSVFAVLSAVFPSYFLTKLVQELLLQRLTVAGVVTLSIFCAMSAAIILGAGCILQEKLERSYRITGSLQFQ